MRMNLLMWPMLAIVLLLCCLPVLIGVYVYRDAKSRGMNAVLWTLIALLAPTLIGLLIYLLVRGSYSNLRCARCGAPVTEQYVSCPQCGARLRATCPGCAAPVEPGWKVCPRCAAPLPEQPEDLCTPVRKQDRVLPKILLAVILIPVLLIVAALLAFSSLTVKGGGGEVTSLPVDDYLQTVDQPAIAAWLDTCGGEFGRAYALRHADTSDAGERRVRYLIYLPGLAEGAPVSVAFDSGLFPDTLQPGCGSAPGGVDSVENVAYNTEVGGKENGTGLQETSGRTVPGNAGEESQAGGDGAVPESSGSIVHSGLAQTVSGDNGRGNNQYLGELVKTELTKRGKNPVDLRTENEPSSFYAAIGEAKQNNEHGAFVAQHAVDEYANMQLFLDDTKGVGVAVTADGDIVSVFKNPDRSAARGSVSSILLTAIQNGGVKLDNFNGDLFFL